MINSLEVFVSDRPVGVLSENHDTGLIDFDYHSDIQAGDAVSLVMPPDVPPAEQHASSQRESLAQAVRLVGNAMRLVQ